MFGIFVNVKRWKFNIEFGWWKEDEFTLLGLRVFEFLDDVVDIFVLKIAKLQLSVNLTKID